MLLMHNFIVLIYITTCQTKCDQMIAWLNHSYESGVVVPPHFVDQPQNLRRAAARDLADVLPKERQA
jgi:hypothetical protein